MTGTVSTLMPVIGYLGHTLQQALKLGRP